MLMYHASVVRCMHFLPDVEWISVGHHAKCLYGNLR
jgi:hypothetical protein